MSDFFSEKRAPVVFDETDPDFWRDKRFEVGQKIDECAGRIKLLKMRIDNPPKPPSRPLDSSSSAHQFNLAKEELVLLRTLSKDDERLVAILNKMGEQADRSVSLAEDSMRGSFEARLGEYETNLSQNRQELERLEKELVLLQVERSEIQKKIDQLMGRK